MTLPISVIIPTFNEEVYLPNLLRSLLTQTTPPKEIIVADAFSTDDTRAVARSFGCRVIDGGLPAKGRNNGAIVATQEILLFLDADVILPPSFIEETYGEMYARNLDITSCFVEPISTLMIDSIFHNAVNYYLRVTEKFHPHIPGFCIYVKKEVHEAINGFDESLVLAEDHDYVRRAGKKGHFSYLESYKIPVSVRRLSEEGRLRIALKYAAIELHLIFLGNVKKNFFKYEFGQHFKLD